MDLVPLSFPREVCRGEYGVKMTDCAEEKFAAEENHCGGLSYSEDLPVTAVHGTPLHRKVVCVGPVHHVWQGETC